MLGLVRAQRGLNSFHPRILKELPKKLQVWQQGLLRLPEIQKHLLHWVQNARKSEGGGVYS